ncbi:hypothetical protein GGR60_000248 [Xanthomonas arboricola]|uniref:efflux RND transporter periplasmic adaptor subunit n=1 Tax=Xanthomonas euroxanthea TaxID=2259622 RepID=UPI0016A1A5BC|nr:efflux RND transporter periplasmic adaptor subunit [Xanthomonas euroxanthea]MBB3814774.1 hypothetical protein [Xanthomonas euroxanthea]NIK07736.1 hypothetical protein [Xanthomonas euroxanthea]NIK37935.1 hypothetical protein [Xanthomonas euroxanthea]NJC35758.1 hypothetical protein [Xanthomonas euroxanthea]
MSTHTLHLQGVGMNTHRASLLLLSAVLTSCAQPPSAHVPVTSPPASLAKASNETELLRLTLSPQAERRLGIVLAQAQSGETTRHRVSVGEIVLAPGGKGGLPMLSTTNLTQIGASQAAADNEVSRTDALAKLADIAYQRAERLVREEAGSIRARDEASAALASARAAADAALAQRRLLGPALAEMARQKELWIRVAASASDIDRLALQAPITARALGRPESAGEAAYPVPGPASSNVAAGTVDLFYRLSNQGSRWRIGQRVATTIPEQGTTTVGVIVPAAAVVRDIHGGEWVYTQSGPHSYLRQRVEIAFSADDHVVVSRGLPAGTKVVSAGAAELFGTEFGVSK